eukprot:gene14290-17_t
MLQQQLQFMPESRPALSLLAYCLYHSGQFEEAASIYERLVQLCPDHDEYKLVYAQSMNKAGMYSEAAKAAVRVSNPDMSKNVNLLLVVNAYEQDDLPGCRQQLDRLTSGSEVDAVINTGCVLYKEGSFEAATAKFKEAAAAEGSQQSPELQYNIALCCYQLKQYSQALKHLAGIVEKGVREHPELSVGSQLDGVEIRSVGNSQVLKETALVEAFNLKAAIEIIMKNNTAAAEALADMPPRSEAELDPVSLHNLAMVNMEKDPAAGFKKLNFLLGSGHFPPETFANLLILYCAPQHSFLDLAADVMAENPAYTNSLLSKELRELLQCLINRKQQPDTALQQLDELSGRHIEGLRGLTKAIQDARLSRNNDAIRLAIQNYDLALEQYIPVLMAAGSIFWEQGAYSALEQLFKQSAEFCSEHDVWKFNVAHTFFMQENKFRDAIRYYQPLVARNATNLLSVPAVILANLCVSYIMTSQNEDAEELMRHVEHEEEAAAQADPDGLQLHLCIINLVIGTLYCSKLMTFLDDVEQAGKEVDAADGKSTNPAAVSGLRGPENVSVAAEASLLKGMFGKLRQMC